MSQIIDLPLAPIIPIVLSGGAGSRLWPLSNKNKPKQLLPLLGKNIMLHDTLERIEQCVQNGLENTIIVTTEDLKEDTERELHKFCGNSYGPEILLEPSSKNTAAAIAYAAIHAKEKYGENSLLWILPADHFIEDTQELRNILQNFVASLPLNKIATFGITPSNATTEYGYIKFEGSKAAYQNVLEFTEKPDKETAESYLKTDQYLWNSGMFLGTAKAILNEYIDHQSDLLQQILDGIENNQLANTYSNLEPVSFDHAIMEKTNNAVVIKADIGWSDVGSWEHIHKLKEKDLNGNVLEGAIITQATTNCLIQSHNLNIFACGINNLAVVEDGHFVLIADKSDHQSISKIKDLLANQKTQENKKSEKFCTQSLNYLVKEITLHQGETISSHYHQRRSEQLIVLSGTAHISVNGEELDYEVGTSISIPFTVEHGVKNLSPEPLKLLEIQYGDNISAFDITHIDNKADILAERV